jgi:hypothetical protein
LSGDITTFAEEGWLVPPTYEIRIAGRLDDAAIDAFAGFSVVSDGEVSVVTGEFDQAALHGLLERVRVLGLDLIDVRRSRGQPRH